MYRNVILDFISNNHKTLISNEYLQMTFVFLQFDVDDLGKFGIDIGNIMIYHVKEPYVFEKQYDIGKLAGTIIEILLTSKEPLTFLYDEVTFEINDPFYLKDLRKQTFKSLTVYPIIENEQIVGFALIYSNKVKPVYELTNNKLLNLKRKLEKDFVNVVENSIKDMIWQEENQYVIVQSVEKEYYCNDSVKKALHLMNNNVDKTSSTYKRVKSFTMQMHKIEKDNLTVFYLLPALNKVDLDSGYYPISNINKHGFNVNFALIYARDVNSSIEFNKLQDLLTDYIDKYLPETIFNFYLSDANAIVIVINKQLNKKLQIELDYALKKIYHIVLNTPTDISLLTNLEEIVHYLDKVMPQSFKFEEYSNYLNSQNKQILTCDLNYFNTNKVLVKVDEQKVIGDVVISPIDNYYIQSAYDMFENRMIEEMDKIPLNKYSAPVFTILLTSTLKRKVIESLKKIITKYKSTKLIIHLPLISDLDTKTCFEQIVKLKNMGFVLIADSTIFMNIKKNICLKEMDAIIIRKFECDDSIYANNYFNQDLFKKYYQEGMVVIYEGIPQEVDVEMINELSCIIIDKENN